MSFSEIQTAGDAEMFAQFGVAAIFNGGDTITVVFNRSGESFSPGTGEIFMYQTSALALAADVPAAMGKTLEVASVTYNIIETKDDGFGLTELRLSKD